MRESPNPRRRTLFDPRAQEARLAGLAPHFAVDLPRFTPPRLMRNDLAVGELAERLAEGVVLLGEQRAVHATCLPLQRPHVEVADDTKSAQRSAIMIVGALVLPPMIRGITDASATRRPRMPWTRSSASTTAIGSEPILH